MPKQPQKDKGSYWCFFKSTPRYWTGHKNPPHEFEWTPEWSLSKKHSTKNKVRFPRHTIHLSKKHWICGKGTAWSEMFNSPLFCRQHPAGYRIVLDFWALNKKDQPEPIKFKKVHDSLMKFKTSKPKIFSSLDLSDHAWQMRLSQDQAAQTAFTIPGHCQFQWNHTPLGVLGAQASFHLLLLALLRDMCIGTHRQGPAEPPTL